MDERHRRQIKKTKKRKKSSNVQIINKKRKTQQENLQSDTLFGLLLAAISTNSNANKNLIKQILNHLNLSQPHDLSARIISLLPILLKYRCAEIVCRSLEIIGALSLNSFESNEMISFDVETVKSLIFLLGSCKRRISMAACNAILDLSTTAVGHRRLIELSAIDKHIVCFIQASKSPVGIVSLSGDEIMLKEDDFPILLLQATIILINSCTVEQMLRIPKELSDSLLVYLKSQWGEVCKQRLCSNSMKCDQGKGFQTSNIKTNTLAESIFRLSITLGGQNRGPLDIGIVKRSVFHQGDTSFEYFLSNYWEVSPLLFRDTNTMLTWQDNAFSPVVRFLKSEETVNCLLLSMLKSIISCPPIASDELNILNFINEVKNYLGCPIIYNQDLRVIKTLSREGESHYFQEKSDSSCSSPQMLHIDDISKCEEAFKEGYSIALRGMEFRFPSIAVIADGLASLFGQPSAGVNMYLTPPNSQGLARHSDDHCVFVCQLMGAKRWTIFPGSSHQLPRLYEPTDYCHVLEDDNEIIDEYQQFLLEEGDILYIPRGFPHEAHTMIDDDKFDKTTGFSLHLTLAIEIEPPFAWEGFIQAALCCWDKKQKIFADVPDNSLSENLHITAINLLCIAIKQFNNLDSVYRKACLVGAISSSSSPESWLCTNQKTLFLHLITKIRTELKFSDALKLVEAAVTNQEDPLEQVRWLKYLIFEEEVVKSERCSVFNSDIGCGFHLLRDHRVEAEAVFMEVKLKFCEEIVFEEVEKWYKVILEKYRKVRKQYTDGMLSLHCITEDS